MRSILLQTRSHTISLIPQLEAVITFQNQFDPRFHRGARRLFPGRREAKALGGDRSRAVSFAPLHAGEDVEITLRTFVPYGDLYRQDRGTWAVWVGQTRRLPRRCDLNLVCSWVGRSHW